MTSSVSLRTWDKTVRLEREYVRIIEAITEHVPNANYSAVLHGSTLWGDRTILRSGVPISDVDVLVIGNTLSDLPAAAEAFRSIADRWAVGVVPFFKLSVKFRTIAEIATKELSANELGALLHGCALRGSRTFEVFQPDAGWFLEQAKLAVRTRLLYVAEQQNEIASSKYEHVLWRYLAARLLLDIPTVGLVSKGFVGFSYGHRVADFLARFLEDLPSEVLCQLQAILTTALLTKRDPESNECPDVTIAKDLLVHYSSLLGLTDPVPQDTSRFWLESRPLDLRDRTLWKSHGRSLS